VLARGKTRRAVARRQIRRTHSSDEGLRPRRLGHATLIRTAFVLWALVVTTAVAAGMALGDDAQDPSPRAAIPDPTRVPEEAVDLEAARQEAHRNSAAGRDERAASRSSFRGQSDAQALATARDKFAGLLTSPPLRWPALRSGQELRGYLGDARAVVAEPSGRLGVIDSTLPLRGETPAGAKAPIDLGLVESGGAYAPRSAAATVRIPRSSSDELRFPDQSFGVSLDRARAQAATISSNKAFFANVADDSDLILEPRPLGAELSVVLRSPAAPTSIPLRFALSGAQRLERSGDGTVKIADGGKKVGWVGPASAQDAQGRSVPVSYRLDGDRLVMEVDTSGELAYPVLVDPPLGVYDNNGTSVGSGNPAGWTWKNWDQATYADGVGEPNTTWSVCNNSGSFFKPFYFCQGSLSGTLTAGGPLFVKANTAWNYGAGQWAEWIKPALKDPDGQSYVYITQFHAANLGHGVNRSKWFAGVWTPWTFNWETGKVLSETGVPLNSTYAYYETPNALSSSNTRYIYVRNGQTTDAISPANVPAFGIKITSAGVTGSPLAFGSIGGGATISSERTAPTLDAEAHTTAPPGGWVDSYSDSVSVTARDHGFGMGTITASGPGLSATKTACTPNGGPTGEQSLYDTPCALTLAMPSTAYTAPEGINDYRITAKDLVTNQDPGQDETWQVKVDRSAPTINSLSGPLWDDRNLADEEGTTDRGVINAPASVTVDATDGVSPSGAASLRRSGIASIEMRVDGQLRRTADRHDASCTAAGCPFDGPADKTFTLDPAGLAPGDHAVKIIVRDQLAPSTSTADGTHVKTQEFAVYVDATDADVTEVISNPNGEGDPPDPLSPVSDYVPFLTSAQLSLAQSIVTLEAVNQLSPLHAVLGNVSTYTFGDIGQLTSGLDANGNSIIVGAVVNLELATPLSVDANVPTFTGAAPLQYTAHLVDSNLTDLTVLVVFDPAAQQKIISITPGVNSTPTSFDPVPAGLQLPPMEDSG
jgi:hypothetical protein